MRTSITAAFVAATTVSLLSACAPHEPPAEALRPVRAAEIRYATERAVSRYFGAVQARYEVDQAFRVGAEAIERLVDVGQNVREGEVIARLDDTDYRLAEQAAASAARSRRDAEASGGVGLAAPASAEAGRLGGGVR